EAGRAFVPSSDEMKSLGDRVPGARRVLDGMGVKSLISVPLRWQNQLVGAMQVFSSEESRYGERDRMTMERIANQVSGALAITRLTESLQEDVHERMVMADLSRILASVQDPRQVVGPFVEKLREQLSFDTLFVNTLDYSAGELVDWFDWGDDLPGTHPGNRQPLAGTLTERLASSRAVFRFCAENEQDALENVPNSLAGTRIGMRSWLSAPMISNNRVVGSIHLRSKVPNAYTARSEAVLERVASQVAGAFANALAHESETALATEREKSFRLDVEKQELQRLNEMRDRFLGMVSHELKTPLTSVYAFANILARNNTSNLSPRQLNHIRVIQRNSRRLDMMIGDLLDVSRIEQGTFSLINRPFNTRVMLAEVVESLEPIFEEKAQILEITSDLGDDMIDGDRNRIGQVIANLLSNASKYSREQDTISLRAWVSDSRFTISVEDHGMGIGESELLRVFEPFYRIDNDITRKAPGTGIGLFVARTIVEQHNGKVEVVSAPGTGTTVSFWIPKVPPVANTDWSPR
ncbi:MAG TPA: ATP-binding protein, partial [Steroidobacteraceae bacterium]